MIFLQQAKEKNVVTKNSVKIAYFPLRGRAQVPRLLLQYLKVPYQDVIFQNVKEWMVFKTENQKQWPLISLPYLEDGDIKITETVPICNYIIRKYGHQEMLGKNLRDQAILNMYTWSIDNLGISLAGLCWMQGSQEYIQLQKQKFWNQNVQQKMESLQLFIGNKNWMLGYLSLFDFSIYELVHYIDIVFPRRIKQFQKLLRIQKKVRELPEIKKYECSSRSIKVFLPPNPLKSKK